MREKTIAERLREVKANRVCSGSFISTVLNGKEAGCKDLYGEAISCSRCTQLWANKLADSIEAENIEFRTMGFLEGLRGADTQEAIDDDTTMPPWVYCEKHGIDIGPGSDESDTFEAMCKHLLARQRKLLGGE